MKIKTVNICQVLRAVSFNKYEKGLLNKMGYNIIIKTVF